MDYVDVAMARSAVLSGGALLLALAACSNRAPPSGIAASSSASAAPPASAVPEASAGPGASTHAPTPANPLGLPPAKIVLDAGKRVFTFTAPMMASARPGATLVLSAATVAGMDGDELIVEGHAGPSYRVHPGYVIPVPDAPRVRQGDAVLTERGGRLEHAVVTRFVKDKVAVRFLGADARAQEALLQGGSGAPTPAGPSKAARFVRQAEGLAPGNYAALHEGASYSHVMLVSAHGEGEGRRWFALGYGGAARIVAEADLKPIPLRYNPRLHAVVWAESGGKMRRATVERADDPGLFTVKYERAGRPVVVGWGSLMAPLLEE
jgi:hypothetical protein